MINFTSTLFTFFCVPVTQLHSSEQIMQVCACTFMFTFQFPPTKPVSHILSFYCLDNGVILLLLS